MDCSGQVVDVVLVDGPPPPEFRRFVELVADDVAELLGISMPPRKVFGRPGVHQTPPPFSSLPAPGRPVCLNGSDGRDGGNVANGSYGSNGSNGGNGDNGDNGAGGAIEALRVEV